ncbi:protein ANTAGONIST OF LIKE HETEROCHROMATIN PROTEIN 1-like [Bidens hawaiensis]|uniref:protein ANTAGONIST OF LIKE HETEROCHROMATIN PROTEIN 1-like n=1 Tax=Bidens hawaiensis TaxID=980011 RepID=UPI004049A1FA
MESPSKAKPQKKKKNKKPSKRVTEKNDEQPTKMSRQKWPNNDEVLLAQGVISSSVDPIIGNNQTGDAYWSEVEKYYNESEPEISKPGRCQHFKYFTQRYDDVGVKGLSPIQKCTSAIRQLAYGASADQCDEYIRIGESTSIECLHKFCRSVVEVFGPRYLRRPNQDDIQRLLQLHSEKHGFVGMLGSIDCMHWAWRNYPTAWKGQYTRGDHGHPTIMLEAVASHDLWIWHAFFGVAGSNNDINVLNQSPVFNQLLEGNAPQCNFIVNGNEYTQGYSLADGIYPEWSTLVKSFVYPPNNNLKMQYFKRRQESCRKDVERAFGVLQSRWAIIRGPGRSTSIPVLGDIMHACIILHSMIVEDEGHMITDWSREEHEPEPPSYNGGAPTEFAHYLQRFRSLRSKYTHIALRNNLMEHLWDLKQANVANEE